MDNQEYFSSGAIGTKLYLINEKIENLPQAKRFMQKLYYLDKAAKFVFAFFITKKLFGHLMQAYSE